MALLGGDDPAGDAAADPVLRGLTPAQRAAVTAPTGPVCVTAGAGSGKTRVLTRRVAHRALMGEARPEHTVVVTFTRKAAAELRRRLWQLGVEGVTTGTFHGLAYAELRRHWADTGRAAPAVVADPAGLLRRLLADGPPSARRASAEGDVVRAVAAEIDWAQARALGPDTYAAAARAADRRPPIEADDLAELLARYGEEKRRRRVVDLHDLVAGATGLLRADRSAAEATRWRVRHLLVDEFQDVNPAQWQLLRALLGDRRDLFVVGDPNQAIYSWNGADPTLMRRLPSLLPGTTVLALDDNHRCTPQVAAAAAAVLAAGRRARRRAPAEGTGDDGRGSPVGKAPGDDAAEAGRAGPGPPASTRPDGPYPEVHGFDDDAAEAAAAARWLRLVHQPGARWANLAVLARTHARLAPMAAALTRAGIPHRYGGERLTTGVGAATERTGADAADDAGVPGAGMGGAGADGAGVHGAAMGGADGPPDDAVELATFHRAKGLEWDAVAVVGLEDGLVPITYARSPAAEEEEQRLLYVALTRASRHLWCSWAAQRAAAPRSRAAQPSPWLAAVERAAQPPPVAAAPVARHHLRLLRQQLGDGG